MSVAASGAIASPTVGSSVAYTWGSTRAEREAPFPCDRHLADADEALFRAVDVDAPPAVVFRWLCQLKAAPYSYDWIDNFGRESPRHPTPGLEVLAVGQRVMGGFVLVEFESDHHLTVVTQASQLEALFGTFAVSYVVVPRGEAHARLVIKLLARYAPGRLGWAARWLLPWGDLVMMRKQLLTLKHLAETTE